ncbi:PREDICTED: uncharacterized protein LOC106115452 [Papilio xuthus]|uniref:Uncharacterized protein LOC106115452 n=1 Tax=Papilio xuthus TaxID=66420 RepID=A0AAJ7E5U5_PAPXU|nr:PREDICTED: uncharacterized protein LOC106115452 [Papilio xuthus]
MASIRSKIKILWLSAVVWALLISSGAAFDWYDEPGRPLNEDIFYQNYNVETGPRAVVPVEDGNKDAAEEMGRAMLLYKIMQSLKLSRGIAGQYYRPNPDTIDYVDVDQTPMNMDIKVAKRVAKAAQPEDAKNTKPNAQAQTQSKPAKVKPTRVPVICYFKLCSYRVTL